MLMSYNDISLEPDTLQANSMLPKMSSLSKLPATRATNKSPIHLSKTSSTGTPLSTQDSTMTLGY